MKTLSTFLLLAAIALAQTPAQQLTQQPPVKPIPPIGVEVPAADRTELENGLRRLKTAMEKLKEQPPVPGVVVYHEAGR